jgi:hypothetical protein
MELLADRYVSPYFQTSYYHDVDLVNTFYPNSIRFFDFIKGRFAGLYIAGNEDSPEFYLHNTVSESLKGGPKQQGGEPGQLKTPYPYFYLNEIQTSFQNVKDLPLSEIALIRYIPPPAYMAPMNGGFIGVIAVYTKKWDEGVIASKTIDETHGRNIFHGYSITREFPEPDYSRDDSLASKPDFRTTLYWNPDLIPDSAGRVHFSFYNSDHAKKYRIVIEGMDSGGRLMYLDSLIERYR